MRLRFALFLPLPLLLAGCSLAPTATPSPLSGMSLQGTVHGGQQPVVGARVYLFAAGTSGYGSASTSLLGLGSAGSDSIGSYVLTDSNGAFSITGDYLCVLGQQVYLYALGGNPGAGTNASSGMMAALGACPGIVGEFAASVPFISINELSTVAFAYATAGFSVDPVHIGSSGTALATTGITNAFAAPANMVSTALGSALGTTPFGNGTVPATTIDTLGNVLAACINSNGTISGPTTPTPCYTLFNNATNGSALPTDTAGAAINIAHNPTVGISALYGLQTASAPFVPNLSSAPNDLTLGIAYTGGGLSTSTAQMNGTVITTNNIAIDGSGNVWKPNYGGNSITEISPLGVPISSSIGYTGGGLSHPANVTITTTGYVFTGNTNSVSEFTNAGSAVLGTPFSGGGITSPANLAVDGYGNLWVANSSTLSELNVLELGVLGSPFSTNALSAPAGIAILPSGNVWVANSGSSSVAVYTSTGAKASGSPFTGGGLASPYGVAFDGSGYGWLANSSSITRLSSTGAAGSSPYAAPSGGIPYAVAIDGLGNAWVTDQGKKTILELNSSGSFLSGATNGYQYGQTAVPEAIAIDPSGNVWYSTTNDATIHELVGAAAPVVTPLATGVLNSTLGTRP